VRGERRQLHLELIDTQRSKLHCRGRCHY
jgi:hypothetical protein